MEYARPRIPHHVDPEGHKASATEKTILLLVVILPLVATTAAVVLLWNKLVTPLDVGIFAFMYVLTACGIGVGFHRMLTHRSFESDYPAVRYVFLAMGSMALQGPAVEWAATHVKHHAKSDKEGDPHSPLEGFWHSHVGWLFRDRLIKKGVWAKPFENDKVAHAVDRQFWLWAILSFLIPGLLGLAFGHTWGAFWSGVLWGGLVRLAIGHHITWAVNSVCHTFGQREFESNDESRNEWVVGLLGLGEGWHNNHHAFPKAAYHGMKWYQIDFNAYVIRGMKRLGWVRNVWMPKAEDMEARRVRKPSNGLGGPATTLGLAKK
jgi:stearoyl-CoA desaturase (delta-9 desaturase)